MAFLFKCKVLTVLGKMEVVLVLVSKKKGGWFWGKGGWRWFWFWEKGWQFLGFEEKGATFSELKEECSRAVEQTGICMSCLIFYLYWSGSMLSLFCNSLLDPMCSGYSF